MWVVTTTYSLDIGLLCPEGQQKWLENTPHEGAEVNAVRIFFLNKNLESIGSCLLCWVWNFSRAFFCTSSLSDFLRFFCFCCWNDHEPSDISVTWPRPGCYSLKSGKRGSGNGKGRERCTIVFYLEVCSPCCHTWCILLGSKSLLFQWREERHTQTNADARTQDCNWRLQT